MSNDLPADPFVTLELKCCCCGRVLETVRTHLLLVDVRADSLWTRTPCAPCEAQLAAEDAELHRGGAR